MYWIAGIIFVIVGIIMLWKPQLIFLITESWKHSGEVEPSDLFIISTRLGGGLATVIGIAAIILQFFL